MAADATNLASEFYILSILQRLGMNAALTLANRKAIDIVIANDIGIAVTVDVKGSAGTTGFFVDNQVNVISTNHFVVFVTFLGKISDPTVVPEVYIVPSAHIKFLAKVSPSGRSIVHLPTLRKHNPPYRDNWQSITQILT